MANVKTFNLSVYLPGYPVASETCITFRGISRVAVDRYIKYYADQYELPVRPNFNIEERV